MKMFFLDKFDNKKAYDDFVDYALYHSDMFSLVYFKPNEQASVKKNLRYIKNTLKPYKICSFADRKWPNTITYNDNNHKYQIVLYYAKSDVAEVLKKAKDIFDWQYPLLPDDLCFFRSNRCWISITAHEHTAYVFSNDMDEIKELKDIGADLTYINKIKDSELYNVSDWGKG